MKIAWEQLYRLPVVTDLGRKVGVIVGIDIATDSHVIEHYHVKPGTFLTGLLSKDLLIAPAQVIGITETEMTIQDSAIPAKEINETARTRLTLATPSSDLEMRDAE